jgi:hypothetical protein
MGKGMTDISSWYIDFIDTYGVSEIISLGGGSYVIIIMRFYHLCCTMSYIGEQGC